MKQSTRTKMAVAGVWVATAFVIAAVLFGPSFFRSHDYAFTQLMGFIETGDSRASVRWTYLRYRASGMQLIHESPTTWSVHGRWNGESRWLRIRFSGSRVQSIVFDVVPPNHALQRTASPPSVRASREFASALCAQLAPPRPSLSLSR